MGRPPVKPWRADSFMCARTRADAGPYRSAVLGTVFGVQAQRAGPQSPLLGAVTGPQRFRPVLWHGFAARDRVGVGLVLGGSA